MITILAALAIAQTVPQRLSVPLRVLQIDPDARISIVGSNLTRRAWGSVIIGPREKLDKELERLNHDRKTQAIYSHTAEAYPGEQIQWSVTKNRDSLDVRATVVKPGPPSDLTLSWRFTGGPAAVSTSLSLNAGEEALVTASGNGRKLMLVVRVDAG